MHDAAINGAKRLGRSIDMKRLDRECPPRMTARELTYGAANDAFGSSRHGDEAGIGISGGATTMRDYIRAFWDLERLMRGSDSTQHRNGSGDSGLT